MSELTDLLASVEAKIKEIQNTEDGNVIVALIDEISDQLAEFDADAYETDIAEEAKAIGYADCDAEGEDDDEKQSDLQDIDLLHEAICEGRKQDAIDILNDLFPNANLRRVDTQNHLFPERVIE